MIVILRLISHPKRIVIVEDDRLDVVITAVTPYAVVA
jgi:hypothetical protein